MFYQQWESSNAIKAQSLCHYHAIIMPFTKIKVIARHLYAIIATLYRLQCNYSATNTQFLRHLFRSILFQEDNNIDISVNTQYYNGNVIIIFDNN